MGSTQPLTEMSTRNVPGDDRRPARKADNLTIYEPIVYKMWEPHHLTALWVSMARYRDTFTLPIKRDPLYNNLYNISNGQEVGHYYEM
jgi:hypothetical protein